MAFSYIDRSIDARRKRYLEEASVLSEQLGFETLACIAAVEAVDRARFLGVRYDRVSLEQNFNISHRWTWVGHYLTQAEDAEIEDGLPIATAELHAAIDRGEPKAVALTKLPFTHFNTAGLNDEARATAFQLDAEHRAERKSVELDEAKAQARAALDELSSAARDFGRQLLRTLGLRR